MKQSLLILTLFFSTYVFSQIGTNDPTFAITNTDPSTGFNQRIYTHALQSDGKIVVGGWFTAFNGITANYIARLNPDGTLDNTFNTGTGFNFYVYSLSIQTDGKIVVIGDFSTFNGNTANHIARLNSDGTIDPTFNTGTGFNNSTLSLALQPDGKIMVGGVFTNFNGTNRTRIARLNTNGSVDGSFTPGTGFNANVWSLAVQPDGKIIAGGDFTSYNGTTGKNYIIRLDSDGTLDNSFNTGTGFNDRVNTIVIQPDNQILIGGGFTAYNGNSSSRMIRLNPTAEQDPMFTIGTGFNDRVNAIALQTDGKIIAGGNFGSFNGNLRNKLVRLNPNGAIDTPFTIGTGFNDEIKAIVIQPDEKIIASGIFGQCNGMNRTRITRLLNCSNPSTSIDTQVHCSSYTWIDGNTYSTSNNTALYTMVNGAVSGCDSIITLNLTITPETGIDTQEHCGSYTWINGITYFSSNNTGVYTLANGAVNGCDSVVTLNLSITTIDQSVSVNGMTLTANQTGATYAWIDCNNNNQIINGETAQTFEALQEGTYAVEITLNNCSETSNCITVSDVGISSEKQEEWKVYPNPVKDKLFIEINQNMSIEIENACGMKIHSYQLVSGINSIKMDELASGIYFLHDYSGRCMKFVKN